MVLSPLFCDTCGAANQPRASFCRTCGHPLQAAGAASRNPATGHLLTNHMLKQRYRILDSVGKGGMGAVYRAEDIQLGSREVAVKEMSQSSLSPQQVLEAADAFKQEAHILARLHHPNLPYISDHFSEAGRWYLVMSFIQGETLEEYLKSAKGGRLPMEEVLQIGIQLCTVLDYLHAQQPPIIFRDLKPSNIMRTTDGHLYLIDFGIARHFKPGQDKDTAVYGSRGYAAPEQYGTAQTTPHSDIYSLGVVLHQSLSGHDPSTTPFRFLPLQSYIPTIPTELATLIAQMLELDENKRPTSMLLAKQKLQDIAAPPPPKVSPAGVPSVSPPNSNPPAPLAPTQPAVIPVPAPKTPIPPTQPAIVPGTAPPLNKPVAKQPIWVAIGVIVAIVILLAVITPLSRQNNQPINNVDTTATAQANAVATLSTDNPNPYGSGTLALYDPLSDNSHGYGWSNACMFTGGTYHASEQNTSSFFGCYESVDFSNFTFEVQMQITKGNCGGILFRSDSTTGKQYSFFVCQNGYYRLDLYVDNTGANAKALASNSSSAINIGLNASNVIAVVANGSTLDLYVNKQKIASVTDSSYSHGRIGLSAWAVNNPTEVVYSNARAWTF